MQELFQFVTIFDVVTMVVSLLEALESSEVPKSNLACNLIPEAYSPGLRPEFKFLKLAQNVPLQ